MAKIIVRPGDTLSKLSEKYLGDASRWRELGKQIGITTEAQAKSLKPGSELDIPDSETDIKGTLKDDNTKIDTQGKTLPESPEESFNALTAFRSILKRVTQQKANDARANALKSAGIDPSTISAGGLQSLVSLAQTAATPLSDIYTTTVDLLQQQEDSARSQLNLMISTGTIADASDGIIAQFSRQVGMQYGVLDGLRKAAREERDRPVKSVTIEKGGRTVIVNLDKNGKIVSETDIGPAKSSISSGNNRRQISSSRRDEFLSAGFTEEEGNQIELDIREFGIDSVVDGMDEAQANSIREIYGGESNTVSRLAVEEASRTAKQEDVENYLRAAQSRERLEQLALEFGFNKNGSNRTANDEDIQDFLNSAQARIVYRDLLLERYENGGFTVTN